jgi:hypothetical protein
VISVVKFVYPGTLIELKGNDSRTGNPCVTGCDCEGHSTPNPAQGLERGWDGGEVRIMTYKREGSILWYSGRNVTSVSVICINGH